MKTLTRREVAGQSRGRRILAGSLASGLGGNLELLPRETRLYAWPRGHRHAQPRQLTPEAAPGPSRAGTPRATAQVEADAPYLLPVAPPCPVPQSYRQAVVQDWHSRPTARAGSVDLNALPSTRLTSTGERLRVPGTNHNLTTRRWVVVEGQAGPLVLFPNRRCPAMKFSPSTSERLALNGDGPGGERLLALSARETATLTHCLVRILPTSVRHPLGPNSVVPPSTVVGHRGRFR